MEQKIHKQLPDGTWKSAGYRVVEHTKFDAGNRNVNLVQDARKILEMIRISSLIDSGKINIGKIRELAGNEDERTTFHNYCYNRETNVQTHWNIEEALSHAKSNQV